MDTADAYPFRTLAAPLRFAIALAAVTFVFLIDRLGGELISDGSRYLMLGMAVMTSAWFAGTGPALAATLLGAIVGAMDAGDGSTMHPSSPMNLALFVVQGLLLTGVVGELRSARRRAEHEASDARAAREEGEAANRMKDEFLATISHELRTPLNAVLGWVHLLKTGKLDAATSTRGLESIERNIRLQAQLTADLLDVSKALTGKLQLECRASSLNDAAQRAAQAVEAAARARGVSIEVNTPAEPVVVLGDPERLRQVVWHLLANAIKFTPQRGHISLAVGSDNTGAGRDAWVRIEDTGQGIDPEFLPRIFDRFTQADQSATRNAGGLGVGLALVRELVELQGGVIDARNRSDIRGAVFTARFPLQPSSLLQVKDEVQRLSGRAQASPPLDGLRVLVLDQDQEGRELVRTALQQRGATVRAVSSVADALESLEAWSPDILVSDSSAPEHDSYALVGKVHSLDAERGGRIPALALTSAARTDQRLSQLLAGVQCDVPKPVEPALLAAEIARLTGRERRRAVR